MCATALTAKAGSCIWSKYNGRKKVRRRKREGEEARARESVSFRPRVTFNRAAWYVDHDQRETVPILVRPRDKDDDDSGTVDFRDANDGSPAADSFKQHGRLNPNILTTLIWSNERSLGAPLVPHVDLRRWMGMKVLRRETPHSYR